MTLEHTELALGMTYSCEVPNVICINLARKTVNALAKNVETISQSCYFLNLFDVAPKPKPM